MSRSTLSDLDNRVTKLEVKIEDLRKDLKEAEIDRKETKTTVFNIDRTLNELVRQNNDKKERWQWLKSNLPGYFAIALIVLGWLIKQDALFHI